MYGVIDGILDAGKIKARLYDELNGHEFHGDAVIDKTAFSEKDWGDITQAPDAGFIFLINDDKCILRRENMNDETKAIEPKYITLSSGATVCLDNILVVGEVKKIEGLCTESYIFHIHYRGQSLPVVMPYDGNNYLARKDHAELCRKLTGEKE